METNYRNLQVQLESLSILEGHMRHKQQTLWPDAQEAIAKYSISATSSKEQANLSSSHIQGDTHILRTICEQFQALAIPLLSVPTWLKP